MIAVLVAAAGIVLAAAVVGVIEYVLEGTTARFAVWAFLGWSMAGFIVLGVVVGLWSLAVWVLS